MLAEICFRDLQKYFHDLLQMRHAVGLLSSFEMVKAIFVKTLSNAEFQGYLNGLH